VKARRVRPDRRRVELVDAVMQRAVGQPVAQERKRPGGAQRRKWPVGQRGANHSPD
jgi:hypothetical protein